MTEDLQLVPILLLNHIFSRFNEADVSIAERMILKFHFSIYKLAEKKHIFQGGFLSVSPSAFYSGAAYLPVVCLILEANTHLLLWHLKTRLHFNRLQ